jgi:hypothetical protein
MTFKRTILSTCAVFMCTSTFVSAQSKPGLTFNMYGNPGLIDMPSAEMLPDAELSSAISGYGGTTRANIAFQILPRVSGTFRYSTLQGDRRFTRVDEVNADRSFDVRFQLLEETTNLPAVAVGLRDFMGTGIFGAEYIVATKNISPSLKVTAGIGWGRLSNSNTVRSSSVRRGGTPNFDQWFTGPSAPFGGVEWTTPLDKLTLKAEYSSDIYARERDRGNIFTKSQFNFGLEYRPRPGLHLGLNYIGGNELGASIAFPFNVKTDAKGGIFKESAPIPITPRAANVSYSTNWTANENAEKAEFDSLSKLIAADGLVVQNIALSETTAHVYIRNSNFIVASQAIGRTARAMARSLPASVETFNVTIVEQGIPTSTVTLKRSDLEDLEHDLRAPQELLARSTIQGADPKIADGFANPDLHPKFIWSIAPYLAATLFEDGVPVRADVGIRAKAQYNIASGFSISGSLAKPLTGNRGNAEPDNSALEPVRTNSAFYFRDGDPAIETLKADYYFKFSPDVYGHVTAGYLETMFGGIAGEVLYKPTGKKWAVGAEVAYVKQREFKQLLGFQDYETLTGHVSGYYQMDNGFRVQVDTGRFLAQDWGATVGIDRVFANGWKVGAYATKTDVSGANFGEGNFDKGMRLTIPLASITGRATRNENAIVLQSLSRDGGARLDVEDRLYDVLDPSTGFKLESGWGKFWR